VKKKKSKIPGNSLEEKLFRLILLLSIVMAMFWLIYRVFYYKNTALIITHLSSFTTFCVLYIWYRKTRSFEIISLVYFFIMMVFFSIGYFPSGGIQGSALMLAVFIYTTGLLVLPPRFFIFYSFLVSALVLLLAITEYLFPDLVDRKANLKELMTIGRIITNLTLFAILGGCLYFFKKEYVNEAHKKKMVNDRLSQEKERLESSERYKLKFLNSTWEQMSAPMAGIEYTLSNLANTPLDEGQQKLLERLNNE